MANFYVTKMVTALQEYCTAANISVSPETLTGISWSGLHNTTAWGNLPPATRQTYASVWSQELTAGGCP